MKKRIIFCTILPIASVLYVSFAALLLQPLVTPVIADEVEASEVSQGAQAVTSKDPAADLDAAKQVIQAEQVARVQACEEEISKTLSRYQCTLACSMILTVGGNRPVIEVVPIQLTNP
jgi:hypothetical protein